MNQIPMLRFFLGLILLVVFVLPHSPTRSVRGACISLCFAHMYWYYCTIPRKCRNSLTLLGRLSASIPCTAFGLGLISSLVSIIIIIIIILIHYHKRLTCHRIESAYRFIGLVFSSRFLFLHLCPACIFNCAKPSRRIANQEQEREGWDRGNM